MPGRKTNSDLAKLFSRIWRQLHDSLLVLTASFEYQRVDCRTLNDITV